jgi:flagellar biosynthesis GTPase FlhF
MKLPTIFSWINQDIESRKEEKEKFDEMLALSNKSKPKCIFLNTSVQKGEKVRLLDEGKNIAQDFIIPKGTIKAYYDSLPDDYVGYINIGHFDVCSFPLILGYWEKSDLEIVPTKDGRVGLNCTPHFDENNPFVQYLSTSNIPLSVSVEMEVEYDWEKTKTIRTGVFSRIFIKGFSVVGNPANASSTDLHMSKGENMSIFSKLLSSYSDEEQSKEVEVETEKDETVENTSEDVQEEKTEESVEEEKTEESVEEEVEENAEDIELSKEYEALEQLLKDKDTQIAELTKKVNEYSNNEANLNSQLEQLAEQNKQLNTSMSESFEKLNALLKKSSVSTVKESKKQSDAVFG